MAPPPPGVVVTGVVFVAVGVTGLAPPVVLVVATVVVGWPVVGVGGWLTVFVNAGAVVVGVVLVLVWVLGLDRVGVGFTFTWQVLVASDSTVLTP